MAALARLFRVLQPWLGSEVLDGFPLARIALQSSISKTMTFYSVTWAALYRVARYDEGDEFISFFY